MSRMALGLSTMAALGAVQRADGNIARANLRLATGQAASAVEQPTAYYVSEDLKARAAAFQESNAAIDQAIGFLEAARVAGEAIIKVYKQMKGLALSAKSAPASERKDLARQFDELRSQINTIARDATFLTDYSALSAGTVKASGMDFNNGTTSASYQKYTAQLSPSASLTLDLKDAFSLTLPGLIANGELMTAGPFDTNFAAFPSANPFQPLTGSLMTSMAGVSEDATGFQFLYGMPNAGLQADIADATTVRAIRTDDGSGYLAFSGSFKNTDAVTQIFPDGDYLFIGDYQTTPGSSSYVLPSMGYGYFTDDWNPDDAAKDIDKSITALNSILSGFGNSINLLKIRKEFNMGYANTLTEGADKLTLPDLNEEAATVVSEQVRREMAMRALSFAGDSDRAVLKLFE